MKVTEIFHNVKCDCCGEMLDENWWREEDIIETLTQEAGWKHLGGKDYCMDCWEWDGDDNIITKDGRKFNDDGVLLEEKADDTQ